MQRRVRVYVSAVVVFAVIAVGAVRAVSAHDARTHLTAALCFAALGVLAHLLAHRLPHSAAGGSIGFLPFLAAVLVAPGWVTILSVIASVATVEIWNRREPLKATFNVAQVTLALAVCVLAYRFLGGEGMASKADLSWPATSRFAIAFALFLTVNSLAVSGVIGVSTNRNILHIWRSTTHRTLMFDFLSFPFVYVFALGYLEYGIGGVTVLALQLLGVRQLYKTNWQLEKTNQDLLQLMVAAIEARDPYTSGHSRRVSEYSRVIARAVGLPPKQVERVTVAALLHDVGKIHEIFAPILRKPARLTDEEMAIMKTHPIKSAELVQNVSQLKDVVRAVRHHHENWDGSGYPDGLRGVDIPLEARIIMFADTIDAMTSDRPYRAALGEVQVRAELTKLSGRQFDPHLCEVLLSSPSFKSLFKGDIRQRASTPLLADTLFIPTAVNM